MNQIITKVENNIAKLVYDDCASCQYCCHSGVPEGVCSYTMIEAIQQNRIPQNLIRQLQIYQISQDKMDEFAEKWWHYPDSNILYNLTLEENGYYRFLVIPYADQKCIFLSDNGCLFPEIKALDCGLFPFYFDHEEFVILDDECPMIKNYTQAQIKKIKQELWKKIQEYSEYCQAHQEQYFKAVKMIQRKYDLESFRI